MARNTQKALRKALALKAFIRAELEAWDNEVSGSLAAQRLSRTLTADMAVVSSRIVRMREERA